MKRIVKIPKELMEEKPYCKMTNGSKILFGILLDLKKHSRRRDWIDGKGYRYVLLPKKRMKEALNCSRYLIDKYTRELELTGLIRFEYIRTPIYERRIYVRSFDPQTAFITMEYTTADKVDNNEPVSEQGINMDVRDTSLRNSKEITYEKIIKAFSQNYPMAKAEAVALTLKHIRMMTCIIEEMMGEFYEIPN